MKTKMERQPDGTNHFKSDDCPRDDICVKTNRQGQCIETCPDYKLQIKDNEQVEICKASLDG